MYYFPFYTATISVPSKSSYITSFNSLQLPLPFMAALLLSRFKHTTILLQSKNSKNNQGSTSISQLRLNQNASRPREFARRAVQLRDKQLLLLRRGGFEQTLQIINTSRQMEEETKKNVWERERERETEAKIINWHLSVAVLIESKNSALVHWYYAQSHTHTDQFNWTEFTTLFVYKKDKKGASTRWSLAIGLWLQLELKLKFSLSLGSLASLKCLFVEHFSRVSLESAYFGTSDKRKIADRTNQKYSGNCLLIRHT